MGELELPVGAAQAVYATLPSVIQPHMLDKATLQVCGASFLDGYKVSPQLSGISCAIDYAHVVAAEGDLVEAKQVAQFAQSRNEAALKQVSQHYGSHLLLFMRLTDTRLNSVYLPYYANTESLPHDTPQANFPFQRRAFSFVQKNVLNPLLQCRPRADKEAHDRIELNSLVGRVVALQTMNRLFLENPDRGFTPVPANIRERHSGPKDDPATVDNRATFNMKLVFHDQTMIPVSVFTNTRPARAMEQHPAIAEVRWKTAGITSADLWLAASAMRDEESGRLLTSSRRYLLKMITGTVLRSIASVEPFGESIYGPSDPRTVQSQQAYEKLVALADQYAA